MKKTISITKIISNSRKASEDCIVKEFPLRIYVNGSESSTLLCSEDNLKYLVIGHLFSENLIDTIEDIIGIKINSPDAIAAVELRKNTKVKKKIVFSGCASFYDSENLNILPVQDKVIINSTLVFKLMKDLQTQSKVFQETGGVHASALADNKFLCFMEDIGRHNSVDKVIGYAIFKKINLKNKTILTTGRLSSEMVIKCARAGIPTIVSKSAPTDMAVNLSKKLNITLIGFARGSRFNIYNNQKNIVTT